MKNKASSQQLQLCVFNIKVFPLSLAASLFIKNRAGNYSNSIMAEIFMPD